MTPATLPQPAPPRWIRLADGARLLGLPSPELLQSEIEAGRAPVRVARLGVRGLVHVCADDLGAYARILAAGVHR